MRRSALGSGVALALIDDLALVGAVYEAIAARGDAQAYPTPGQLVDVGGYSLHILCAGTGSRAAPCQCDDSHAQWRALGNRPRTPSEHPSHPIVQVMQRQGASDSIFHS